jgi:hypothetical protein
MAAADRRQWVDGAEAEEAAAALGGRQPTRRLWSPMRFSRTLNSREEPRVSAELEQTAREPPAVFLSARAPARGFHAARQVGQEAALGASAVVASTRARGFHAARPQELEEQPPMPQAWPGPPEATAA